jgi:hypothetical protein
MAGTECCALRVGNVHSADGWESVLEPVVERYKGKVAFQMAALAIPRNLFVDILRLTAELRLPPAMLATRRFCISRISSPTNGALLQRTRNNVGVRRQAPFRGPRLPKTVYAQRAAANRAGNGNHLCRFAIHLGDFGLTALIFIHMRPSADR